MNRWIVEATELLNRNWVKPAAGKAEVYLLKDNDKDINEILMGYVVAERLLETTILNIHKQKDWPSEEDESNLDLAIKLARAVIPKDHPLLFSFLQKASYYREDLNEEVAQLKQGFGIRG